MYSDDKAHLRLNLVRMPLFQVRCHLSLRQAQSSGLSMKVPLDPHQNLSPNLSRTGDKRKRKRDKKEGKKTLAEATEAEALRWDSVAQLGNLMRHVVKSYNNQAAGVGYQKTGIVPLEEADMPQLLEHMCSNLGSSPSTPTRVITAHQG